MKTFSQIRLEQAINLIVDENRQIKEINVRCPYCGDSKKPTSAHVGVKLTYPTMYHCWICDASGSVNARFLKDVGIDDAIIKKYVKYQKTNVYKSMPTVKEVNFSKSKTDYTFSYIEDSDQYKYLVNRFKMEFSEDDIKMFRVILNPKSFISELLSSKRLIERPKINLNRYIGFLTQDGNQAVFRAIDKDREPRFFNLTIEETDYRKLYVINNNVDVRSKKFNFVLTEGVFYLIGVYKHFYEKGNQLNNTLFVAALGKSYHEPINRLIQSGFLNFDIFLFSDTSEDVTLEFYSDLFDNQYIEEIYIAKNKKEGEKDFGVSLDRIEFDDFELFNRKKLNQMISEKNNNKKKV
jgi:hypothetical protein